ncbi:hypothetical protein MtrunA17_Chr5g0438231 [Medicago truncatula]|uniref:Nodule-specific Glycine Rich Peptide n=1 Tax=Medicago truncatula TaxID=3880 RepID=A0A396HV69_MEDTR|nr:hypothetical protein MtrunA17_Chr5g0438231 [Medicago truncatula]
MPKYGESAGINEIFTHKKYLFLAWEIEKSNTNIGVDCCSYWLGLGAIRNGNKGKNNDGCGDGIEGHCGKGYVDNSWKMERSWSTGWWGSGAKGGDDGKGGKGGEGGGGGYKLPIPGGGKGGRNGKL